MIQGVPDSTDGKMIELSEALGVNIVNKDRMWHYTEGIHNHSQSGLNTVFVLSLARLQFG